MPDGAVIQTIDGRRTIVVDSRTNLPRALPDLLRDMGRFGFRVRDDFSLGGTRPACETLRVHRFRTFREGRWWNVSTFDVVVGQGPDEHGRRALKTVPVEAGMRELRLEMCEDCGAVAVRDITFEPWAGARPARLRDNATGEVRIAPARRRHDLVIGWYSGARRNGREYL